MKRERPFAERDRPARKRQEGETGEAVVDEVKSHRHYLLDKKNHNEEATVFVNHLDKSVTVELIKWNFERFGFVPLDVRQPSSHTRILKPYAYVELGSAEKAQEAVKAMQSKVTVGGRIWSFAISCPPKALYEHDVIFAKADLLTAMGKAEAELWVAVEAKKTLDAAIRNEDHWDSETNLEGHVRPVLGGENGLCKGYAYIDIKGGANLFGVQGMTLSAGDYGLESGLTLSRSVPMKDHRWHVAPGPKAAHKPVTLIADTLHVRNLDFSISDDDLTMFFEAAGAVGEVLIPRGDDGKGKGFGFVRMESEAQANDAMLLNGEELAGRAVIIQLSDRKITREVKRSVFDPRRRGEAAKLDRKSKVITQEGAVGMAGVFADIKAREIGDDHKADAGQVMQLPRELQAKVFSSRLPCEGEEAGPPKDQDAIRRLLFKP